MNRSLFWKLCLIYTIFVVAVFYLIDHIATQTENEMSMIAQSHRQELSDWAKQAEALYETGDSAAMTRWLEALHERENTWAAIVSYDIQRIAGDVQHERHYKGYHLGRSINWKIHLYFDDNPEMELPFADGKTSLVIKLPERMRPGSYWPGTRVFIQVVLPMLMLAILSWWIYRHIMQPLIKLESATKRFTQGEFSVRVRQLLGKRNDELSRLAETFDQMAARIGELIVTQRQLIADLSHELRTPLTRLEIAVDHVNVSRLNDENLQRIMRETRNIRRLVEDTLTLAWLENEQPGLRDEDLDLVDLIDVILADAKFEFDGRTIHARLPDSAGIKHSSHLAVGQALENIVRNALRYTPDGKDIEVSLESNERDYLITIKDNGPGVPENMLDKIFKPFFRVDESRSSRTNSFGLGLALAKRQLASVGGTVVASNRTDGGLSMAVTLPISR